MRYIVVLRRYLKLLVCIFAVIILAAVLYRSESVFGFVNDSEIESVVRDFFRLRCAALVSGDPSFIEGQFDRSSRYGQWAYEHEVKRIKYLKEWAAARGIKLSECEAKLKIFSIKPSQNSVRVFLSVRTRYAYYYEKQDPQISNEFCLGTRHTISLVSKDGVWLVKIDWYSDPLEDTMPVNSPAPAIRADEEIEEIQAASWFKYNREKAVEYADRYSGANFYLEDGYKYNKKYRNYADLGGDCANFVSQVLADKDAGGIPMGGGWLYQRGEASAAWVNAGAFTKHMIYSGKARLISRGKYEKVVNYTKHLSPGDIIAYEKKGDIVHVSVVTAVDSMGVLLVNSHTKDRYHVPWDLGWNGQKITFWLLRVNG